MKQKLLINCLQSNLTMNFDCKFHLKILLIAMIVSNICFLFCYGKDKSLLSPQTIVEGVKLRKEFNPINKAKNSVRNPKKLGSYSSSQQNSYPTGEHHNPLRHFMHFKHSPREIPQDESQDSSFSFHEYNENTSSSNFNRFSKMKSSPFSRFLNDESYSMSSNSVSRPRKHIRRRKYQDIMKNFTQRDGRQQKIMYNHRFPSSRRKSNRVNYHLPAKLESDIKRKKESKMVSSIGETLNNSQISGGNESSAYRDRRSWPHKVDEKKVIGRARPKPPWPQKMKVEIAGQVMLGGLMMVHERQDDMICGPVMPQGGIQALEAMLYTLDWINDKVNNFIPGVKVGALILDDCDKDTYGLEQAVDFIKGEYQ